MKEGAVMTKRTSIWALMALSLAACGGAMTAQPQSQPRPQPPSPEALEAKAVPYARDTTIAWPRTFTRRQLVISDGWQRDERFTWLIADGTKVVAVYRTGTQEEFNDLHAKLARDLVFATQGSPGDKASWGSAGAIKIPDPPPPGPGGGFPKVYVDAVMTTAWRISTQVHQPLATGGAATQP
jgi:hypothetical protein